MKTNPLDFLLSGLTITVMVLLATFIAGYGIHPFMESLGSYQAIATLILFMLILGVLAGLTIRLILSICPIIEGTYDMDHWYFTEFKWLMMISDTGFWALRPFRFLALTPLFLILFGAKVGKNLGAGGNSNIADPYMVRIGDNVIIGNRSEICGNTTHNGKIKLGYVTIGNNVTIGMNCTLFPNVTVGDGATVLIGSVVMPDTVIPPGETWRGNPARKWQ